MVIDYEKYPLLKYVKDKKLPKNFSAFECDRDVVETNNFAVNTDKALFNLCNNEYKKIILSEPFIDAYEKVGDKLFDSYLWENIKDQTLLFINCKNDEQTFFKIYNNRISKKIEINSISFIGSVISYVVDFTINYNLKLTKDLFGWVSQNLIIKTVCDNLLNCALITLFIEYAEIETKILLPKQNGRTVNCKYKNKIGEQITVLDSTWFTNLVKSEGFKVRGHFRLQPCKKDGKWTKELIWINEFEKTGYTAPARKLAAGETQELL